MKAQVRNWLVFALVAVFSFALAWVVMEKTQDTTPASYSRTEHVRVEEGREANRLIHEKSPYLLQHAYNPVNWYPWGPEAFAAARRQDKPVFLSIGYSTCHWCHVMENESFRDSAVAAMLNETFINIKVDREERPDIDNMYMAVCQKLNGSGGWPLTIVMTPDCKPFMAETYIPKESTPARIGLLDIIPRIGGMWRERRETIENSGTKILESLRRDMAVTAGEALGADILDSARQELYAGFDMYHGGFGTAPKFPAPHKLLFLLRQWKRTGDSSLLHMVEKSLLHMRRGGVYDHLGHGFHRYATDRAWQIPHFEKMLYDQAMLLMAYAEAYEATRKPLYKQTVQDIVAYVAREMTDKKTAAFYSAESAISEGQEGKYYVWTAAEIDRTLAAEQARLFKRYYNVSAKGNWNGGDARNAAFNILYVRESAAAIARELGRNAEDVERELAAARKLLLERRSQRVPPGLDDKILTDWNGLMIAGLAKAARAVNEPDYLILAERAANFLLNTMRTEQGALLHRYRAGAAGIDGNLDDYAFLCWGLLELYESGFNLKYLREALALNRKMLETFRDSVGGGLYFSPGTGSAMLLRGKPVNDGAIPSGNSVAMLNLLRLARLSGDTRLEQEALALGRAFAARVRAAPAAHAMLLSALDFSVGPSYEIVVVVENGAQRAKPMLDALRQKYMPNKVVILRVESANTAELNKLAPYTANQQSLEGKATAYVCRNFACNAPVTDVAAMLELLH